MELHNSPAQEAGEVTNLFSARPLATGKETFSEQVERQPPGPPVPLAQWAQERPDAWSADGRRLALADAGGAVRILDAASGKQTAELPPPRGKLPPHWTNRNACRVLSWSPDGRRIATSSGDGQVPVYDAGTGREVVSLRGHEGPVVAVAWSPSGRELASGGIDGKIKVWDAEAGTEEYTLADSDGAIVALAWRPDGRRLAASRSPTDQHAGTFSWFEGRGTTLWDVATRKVLWGTPGTAHRSSDLAWSSDGRRLALGYSGVAPVAATDQCLLDAASARVVYRGAAFPNRELRQAALLGPRVTLVHLPDGQTERLWVPWLSTSMRNLPKYEQTVCIAWHPDGTALALGSSQGNIQVRHLPGEGQRTRTLVVPNATQVAWEPDDRHFTINGSKSGELPLGVSDQGKRWLGPSPDRVVGVALSPDGKRLAASLSDKTIQLWEIATRKRTVRLAGHQNYVEPPWDGIHSDIGALLWSPHRRYLASYRSWDGTLKVWDPVARRQVWGIEFGRNAAVNWAWSPDDSQLAMSVQDLQNKRETSIWDAATGERRRQFPAQFRYALLAWPPDGRLLACAKGYSAELDLRDSATGDVVDTVTDKEHGLQMVNCLAWAPDGRRLAWASSHNGGAAYDYKAHKLIPLALDSRGVVQMQLVWKANGKELAVTDGAQISIFDAEHGTSLSTTPRMSMPAGQPLAWTPDGLLTAALEQGVQGGATLQVKNMTTGDTVTMEPVEPPADGPRPPAPAPPPFLKSGPGPQVWSPDRKHFASFRRPYPADSKTPVAVILYDAEGKVERELLGEPEQINVGWRPLAAWSPDSKFVAGGGNNVRVWDVATGKELFRLLGHDGVVESIAWSPDGRRIVTRSQVKKPFRNTWELKVWDAADGREVIDVRGLVAELAFNPHLTACTWVMTNPVGNDPVLVLWDLSRPAAGK